MDKIVEPLTPAGGRVYASLTQAQLDMDAGLDFTQANGAVVDRETLRRAGYRKITVRFGDKKQGKVVL